MCHLIIFLSRGLKWLTEKNQTVVEQIFALYRRQLGDAKIVIVSEDQVCQSLRAWLRENSTLPIAGIVYSVSGKTAAAHRFIKYITEGIMPESKAECQVFSKIDEELRVYLVDIQINTPSIFVLFVSGWQEYWLMQLISENGQIGTRTLGFKTSA